MHLTNIFKQKPILVSSIFAVVMTLLFITCEKDFSPLTGVEITSHNYTWEVDTLHAPDALQVLMSGIWGTNENNVWVVGHSDVNKYNIWHWDGIEWKNQNLVFPGHPHSFEDIYGFAEDDIWAVGTDFRNYPNANLRSFIIHFDGNQWDLIEEIDAPFCRSVWGSDPGNVFVGCDSGFVLKFDGAHWEKQHTKTRAQIKSIGGSSKKEVLAIGVHNGNVMPIDSTFYYFFRYDGEKWDIVEQTLDYPFAPLLLFGSELWEDNLGNLYSVGSDGLYKRENNTWSHIFKGESPFNLFFIKGSSSNNIFTGGLGNKLYHFNGINWHLYEEFIDPDHWFTGSWSYNQYAFIIERSAGKSFVYRGKRKE